MNITDLKMRIINIEPIYYGRKKINIIEFYEIFNLIDVEYEDDKSIFTIDVMALRESPTREIWIDIV